MKKPKLFVVSQNWYAAPFEDMFEVVSSLLKADVALFTGGEDVSPNLYGESVGKYTRYNPDRDKREAEMFQMCQDYGIKSLGICRGGQFINVQSGGRMVQHVSGHGQSHAVTTSEGNHVMVSSTHHQMMNPFQLPKDKYVILAWAEGLSDTYLNGENEEVPIFHKQSIEPEVIYFPDTEALAVQPHPEIMQETSKGVVWIRELVREYLL